MSYGTFAFGRDVYGGAGEQRGLYASTTLIAATAQGQVGDVCPWGKGWTPEEITTPVWEDEGIACGTGGCVR